MLNVHVNYYSNSMFYVTCKGYLDKIWVKWVMCHTGDSLQSLQVKDCEVRAIAFPLHIFFYYFTNCQETIKVKIK